MIGTKNGTNLGKGFLIGGCSCLLLTAAMNYFQGEMMGVTQAGKWLNSLSSVVVDIVGLVMFGLAAGACMAAKRWGAAALFTLVMLASAGWSATSMISFQATERISASANRESAIARQAKADELVKDQVKWLRGTSRKDDLSRVERKDLLKAASNEIKDFRETNVKTFILPDAGANVIATVSGWKIESVQISMVSYLACLLILLKAICFPSASYFWAPLAVKDARKSGRDNDDGGGGERKISPDKPTLKDERRPPERVPLKPSLVPLRADNHSNVFTLKGPHLSPSSETSIHPLAIYLQEQLARGRKLHSQSQIARLSGWSEPTVSRQLAELVKQGKITREKDGKRNVVRQRIGDGGGRQALATA